MPTISTATACIFDRQHRARILHTEHADDERPLTALSKKAQEFAIPLDFGGPVGVVSGKSPVFAFLLPSVGLGEAWAPLSAWSSNNELWNVYIETMLGGWPSPTRSLEVFHFGNDPLLSAKLAHMVACGKKRGTTGWIEASKRDGSSVPYVGMTSVVTDGYGYPKCIIQTESVETLRFSDITEAHAYAEGEGDRTLSFWRECHLSYFHQEAELLGLTFREDAWLFFEHFRVLAIVGRHDVSTK